MLVLLLVALVVVGSFSTNEEQADQSTPAPPPPSDLSDGKTYETFIDGNPPKVKRQLRRAEEAAKRAVAAEGSNTGNKAQGTYTGSDTYTVTRVVDGDTIEVAPIIDGTEDVRLIGVDTPEVYGGAEPCGLEASAFTESRLEGEQVTLEFDEEFYDPYHRILAYVYVDGQMFNETLVAEGYASVTTYPPNDRYEQRFIAAEAAAPTLACSAPPTAPAIAPVAPSEGGVPPISEENCPAGAPIKGNESSSGELIYHTRSSATYDATYPEECFATEPAAQAAGYRAARD